MEGGYRGPGSIEWLLQKKKNLFVLGLALSDGSATVSPLLGGRPFSNHHCHWRNFPTSVTHHPLFCGKLSVEPFSGQVCYQPVVYSPWAEH